MAHPRLSGQKRQQSEVNGSHRASHSLKMEFLSKRNQEGVRLLSVIVDDDESVRESLPDLLREFGFTARAFSSAKEFLVSDCVDDTSCLILDVGMPEMSGPELQLELIRRGQQLPIIFITGQGDETIRTQVLNRGAAGFLLKPFSDSAILAAIQTIMQAS
jgi:FixJ family two-component response regulator